MRLDDIEKKENLSTEEIVQITSKMAFGNLLHCEVPITSVIKLQVYLNNKAEDHGYIATALVVQNRLHMKRALYFRTHHVHIQHVSIEGRSRHDGNACLSVNDIVNIFELDNSVRWRILGLFNREEDVSRPDWM